MKLEQPGPNFHKILERVGKTQFRPGGAAATEKLLEWSGLTADDSVLELSGGMGNTGIMFAKSVGCHVLITDLDVGRLELAKAQVQQQKHNLSALVQTKQMDMFDITNSLEEEADGSAIPENKNTHNAPAHFVCAIAEASLSHYPLEKKREFFQRLAKHTYQYLLHEICFVTEDPELQRSVRLDMQRVLKLGFFPETQDTWKRLLQDAGFTNIHEVQVGPIAMLNPINLVRDEGPMGAANILKNIVIHRYLRSRVLATRQMLAKHSPEHLGYIILRATRDGGDTSDNNKSSNINIQ
jgi:hypothetical protein